MERVAVISDIIGQSWDGMAESIAQTDAGKIVQMNDATNGLQATIGEKLMPYVLQFQETLTGMLNPALAFVAEHMEVIAPIAVVLGASIGTLAVVIGVVTAAQWLWNSAILANPLTWVVVGIVAVIAAGVMLINHFGGLQVSWLMVKNAFLTGWDAVKIGFQEGVAKVQNFLDKMSIGFSKVGAAIAGFMGDMKVNVLTILENMVNGAIDIINKLIDTVNTIPGVGIETISHVTFAAGAAAENEAAKAVRSAAIEQSEKDAVWNALKQQEAIDTMKAESKAATIARNAEIESLRAEKLAGDGGESLTEKIFNNTNAMAGNMDDLTTGSGKGKALKTTGEVELASEEMQLMLDMATRQYKVDYQSIAPQITISVDTIRENVDVDYVVQEITTAVHNLSGASLTTGAI